MQKWNFIDFLPYFPQSFHFLLKKKMFIRTQSFIIYIIWTLKKYFLQSKKIIDIQWFYLVFPNIIGFMMTQYILRWKSPFTLDKVNVMADRTEVLLTHSICFDDCYLNIFIRSLYGALVFRLKLTEKSFPWTLRSLVFYRCWSFTWRILSFF